MKWVKRIAATLMVLVFGAWLVARLWPAPAYAPREMPDDYVQGAQDWLDNYYVELPENWQWHYAEMADGKKIRWGYAPNPDAKGTVIYIPGFTSTLEMFGSYYAEWDARSYQVMGLDLRGQGGSDRMLKNPEKPWTDDFGIYGTDVAAVLGEMQPFFVGPVILSGTSMGAHSAVRAAEDFDIPVDGLALIVPAFQVKTPGYDTDKLEGQLAWLTRLGFGKRYAFGQADWQPWQSDITKLNPCSSDITRAHVKDAFFTFNPEYRVGGVTNQFFLEFLRGGKYISDPENLARIDKPVLIFTADNDDIVHSAASEQACSDLNDCRHYELTDTHHCVHYDPIDRQHQVMDEIDWFYAEKLGGSP